MEVKQNYIVAGDCIEGMQTLQEGSVDLVFADPPFNTGYHYDVYDDRLAAEAYKDWSRDWIAAVHRILSNTGTFWLAIGDEYAADLMLRCHDVGFHFRSWVIWYYTFGVNCSRKFTRSHTHLLHMVKDSESFTFREDAPENRIPSARQLVYNDKRANPRGRLPDDTWIIPPADLTGQLMEGLLDSPSAPPAAPADNEQTWTLRPQDLSARFQSKSSRHFQRADRVSRMPDARTAARSHHSLLLRRRPARRRPFLRKCHDTCGRQKAGTQLPRFRNLRGLRPIWP